MSASEPSGEEYVFVDFDNIFAFVPEFDLCKLHFSMLECGIRVGLQELAELVASAYGVSLHAAEVGLRRFCPLVLCRLLAWAIKRDTGEFFLDALHEFPRGLDVVPGAAAP